MTQRTHLEKEGEIVWETWWHRILSKKSKKYPLNKLSKVYCNSDPEITYYFKLALCRWVLLISRFIPVSKYYTRSMNAPWSSLIIFMASVIKNPCSGFFTDLSESPYNSNNNIKSTIKIKPKINQTQDEFRSIKIYH